MKRTPLTRCLTVLMVVIAAMVLVTSGGGCSTEQIERYRAANAELKAALDATEAQLADAQTLLKQLDDQIAATPDGPEKEAAIEARGEIAELAKKATAYVAQLREGIDQIEAAIEAALAGDAATAVNAIGPYVASRVPPPYGVYVLAGSTVLGGILTYLQQRKTAAANGKADRLGTALGRAQESAMFERRAAWSVITAIEDEKDDESAVNFDDKATQASLRSRMSTEARDLVEQVRRTQSARLKAVKAAPGSAPGSNA